MKPAVWFCAAVATALAAAILYWYGISLFSVLENSEIPYQ